MDVTELPFNRLIGIEPTVAGSEFLVSLPAGPQYANHLGIVHAVALLAVAEAGAGAFLARQAGVPSGVVPVVRRLEAKFHRPAKGRVSARCTAAPDEVAAWSQELASRGRVFAMTQVEVADEGGAIVLTAVVEWFITRAKAAAEPDVVPDRSLRDSPDHTSARARTKASNPRGSRNAAAGEVRRPRRRCRLPSAGNVRHR